MNRILFASVLVSVVVLSGTACSASNNQTEVTASQTATPGVPSTSNTDKDTANVVATVNGYYSFIASAENYGKVKTAGAELTGKAASDEQLSALASNFPEGFQYFDTSSPQLIKNAYRAMMLGTGSLRMGNPVTITAPVEAVTVEGNNATLNTTWITVTEEGATHPTEPESNPNPSDLINLVKKDDGSWVIVAKDLSIKPSAP